MAKQKVNRTLLGNYFHEKGSDCEKVVPVPTWYVPQHREALHPLTWHMQNEKSDWTAAGLAKTLERGTMPSTLFFVDTCFFSRSIDDVVWQALENHHVVITPFVRRELQPWLDNGRTNSIMRERLKSSLEARDPHIHFDEVDEVQKSHGHFYYARLLGLRKAYGKTISLMLTEKLGREPTDDEFFRASRPRLGTAANAWPEKVGRSGVGPTTWPTSSWSSWLFNPLYSPGIT